MSEPIKAGDLVMVVRFEHECGIKMLGRVFVVSAVDGVGLGFHCDRCGAEDMYFGCPAAQWPNSGWIPQSWLKRIPPPSALDDVKNTEELTA